MLAFEGTAEEKLIGWGRLDMKRDDAIQGLGQEGWNSGHNAELSWRRRNVPQAG